MKSALQLVLGMLMFGLATHSVAQQAWLLLSQGGQSTLMRADSRGLHDVRKLGESLAFGETAQSIGVLSRRNGAFVFDLIDKETRRATATWPIAGEPALQLSGPSRDLVLTQSFAYLAMLRTDSDGVSALPNSAGGVYDLAELSLADGRIHTIALPAQANSPRLRSWEGYPLISSFSGSSVWRLPPGADALDQLVSRHDVEDTIVVTQTIPRPVGDRVPRLSTWVVVPMGGVFRVSRFGVLEQILDKNLKHVGPTRPTLNVGSGGRVIEVHSAIVDRKPAVAVLRQEPQQTVLSLIQTPSLAVRWTTPLPSGYVPGSLMSSVQGGVYFVDGDTQSVTHIDTAGPTIVWTFQPGSTKSDLIQTRIISISDDPQF